MMQEHKELLLKDLCARLPYGVKGNYQNSDDELLRKVTIVYRYLEPDGMVMTGDIKPYLFLLSSMTDEQKKEYASLVWFNGLSRGWNSDDAVILDEVPMLTDFYHKNHLDYRGLIEKGLAIDATGLNIY